MTDRLDRRAWASRALHLLDLTNLDDACTEDDIDRLCARAHGRFGRVAAVCVWPRFVVRAKRRLEGSGVAVATVVNFPSGEEKTTEIVALVERCIADGADDIDLVLPYRSLLAGRIDHVVAVLDAVRAAVPSTVHLKVILETGELGESARIEEAAKIAIDHGADFIKTSTGKTKISATPEAIRIMSLVVARSAKPVGLKPSGGIRTLDDAIEYLEIVDEILGDSWATPSTFRFGASSLLDALEDELSSENRR